MQDAQASPPQWLEYIYRTAHPALRWLTTKLAEWIGENLQDQLGFPDKADQRAEPGTGCTHAELTEPYSSCACGGRYIDYIWMCGMGVTAVQGYYACQMLSLQSAKEALPFLQPQG